MRRPSQAEAEALTDRILQSIRPQVVRLIAEAMAQELTNVAPQDVELTPRDLEQAADVVAHWGRKDRTQRSHPRPVRQVSRGG